MDYNRWRALALKCIGTAPASVRVVNDLISRSKKMELKISSTNDMWFSASYKEIYTSSNTSKSTVATTIGDLKSYQLLIVDSGRHNKGTANKYRLSF